MLALKNSRTASLNRSPPKTRTKSKRVGHLVPGHKLMSRAHGPPPVRSMNRYENTTTATRGGPRRMSLSYSRKKLGDAASYSRKKLGNAASYSAKLSKNAGFMLYTPSERHDYETTKENQRIFREAKKELYDAKKNGNLGETIIEMFLKKPKLVLQFFQYVRDKDVNYDSVLAKYYKAEFPELYSDIQSLRHYSQNNDFSIDWSSSWSDDRKVEWQKKQLLLAKIRAKEINIYEKYIKKVNEYNQRMTNKSSAKLVYNKKVNQKGTVGKTIANRIESYL